jgi:hypothetical protein
MRLCVLTGYISLNNCMGIRLLAPTRSQPRLAQFCIALPQKYGPETVINNPWEYLNDRYHSKPGGGPKPTNIDLPTTVAGAITHIGRLIESILFPFHRRSQSEPDGISPNRGPSSTAQGKRCVTPELTFSIWTFKRRDAT